MQLNDAQQKLWGKLCRRCTSCSRCPVHAGCTKASESKDLLSFELNRILTRRHLKPKYTVTELSLPRQGRKSIWHTNNPKTILEQFDFYKATLPGDSNSYVTLMIVTYGARSQAFRLGYSHDEVIDILNFIKGGAT